MEILKAESPFFIKEVCQKHSLKAKTVWNYIKYHSEKFDGEIVANNKAGRPPIKYTVINSEV